MKLNLFDDYWLDFRKNTTRKWMSPELFSTTENGIYSSLIYDPEIGKYRIYYEKLKRPGEDSFRDLMMIESEDLLHFSAPILCFDGETGVHGTSVMYDPYDPDPGRRYKACGMTRMGRRVVNGKTDKLVDTEVEISFSEDGVHFSCDHEHVVQKTTSDSLNKLFYDPVSKEYAVSLRASYVDRRIAVRTSKDLKNWSRPRIILQPGPSYNNDVFQIQQYGMAARCFGGDMFYGLVWQYKTFLDNMDFSRLNGFIEPELVYSYDGKEFLHTTGTPLITRPLPPEPGCAGILPTDICESPDGEWYYLLCSCSVLAHVPEGHSPDFSKRLRENNIRGALRIYRIRRDGFCGIESLSDPGLVITKPLQFTSDDLTFNLRADCGSVRFGIMDRDGNFFDGFSFDDCIPFELQNATRVRPEWKVNSMKELVGKQVRVAVELRGAILHCIEGSARPYIRKVQKSFSDPEKTDGTVF